VKPLHLNLASRPYRDYRALYAVVVVSSLLIAFMMLNNVDTYYRYIRETKATRSKIADLDRQAETEQRQTQQVSERLRSFNVKVLSEQTQFVNARLAERAFSWSELLDRLERVIPNDVRLESISPTFGKDGFVHLSVIALGKNSASMVHTLDRFNHDAHFANAFPSSEDKTDNGYHFGVSLDYRPSVTRIIQ
jgi:Tfp pilus assembly protein PilN